MHTIQGAASNGGGGSILRQMLRKLWADHVFWTRLYIVSALGNLPDKSVVLQRLLRNQDEIGKVLEPFYGSSATHLLVQLLKQHILLAGKLIEALRRNDIAGSQKLDTDWKTNADEISAFLARINKNISIETMRPMMREHLKLTASEVGARLAGDFAREIQFFDNALMQSMQMADYLTSVTAKFTPSSSLAMRG